MKSLKRIIPFLNPYRWIILGLVATVVIPVVMELIVPKSLNYIIDEGIKPGKMDAIWIGSGIMMGTALTGAIATLGQGVFRALFAQGLAFDLRNKLFSHIQTFSYSNLDKMQTGQLMTRLSSDVDLVRGFSSHGLSLLIRGILMLSGSVGMMFVIDVNLALITIFILPFTGVLLWALLKFARPLFMEVQIKLSALNTIIQENLAGVHVVKAFVREQYEIERFNRHNDVYMHENIKVGKLMAMALPMLTLLTNIGIVAVVWYGGQDVIGDRLTLGELIAFNNYLMIGMAPLMMFGNILTMVSRADASAERIMEVLDTKPDIQITAEPYKASKIFGSVSFDSVVFHYDRYDSGSQSEALHGGRNVLREITLKAEPGQRIALLGTTGSGKSTLVNLIPRFYDVDSGIIKIDDVDVREWDPEKLRQNIGMVLQQTTLFSGTIRENIAYGCSEASLEDIITAAKIAQVHDFIMTLPEGYDSFVEERGANLSGGQKQRIAIARALLISPGILILDDCTSAVDLATEAKIQAALESIPTRCTIFIIAQRISSVLNADQILVMDQGKICARGTHDELLQRNTIYQEIYHSQLGSEEEKML